MSFTKTVLITGGTSGLGLEVVVVASRTDPDLAAETINKTLGQKNSQYLPLDLSSLEQIRLFAADWKTRNLPPIQALLLNAGIQYPEQGVRKAGDGVELTFGGHALLLYLLYPLLAPAAHIVFTSSSTHDPAQKTGQPDAIYNTAEELAHATPESTKYLGSQRYTTSKLTNVMFTYALNRRLQQQGKQLIVVAFDPGWMPGTGLARDAGFVERVMWFHVLPRVIPLLRKLISPNIHKSEESGATLAWLAVSPAVKESGGYWNASPKRKMTESSKDSYDEKKQEDLWAWTVKHVSASEQERKKFDALG
ncbi:NADPH-protochlorophyllide oxidoreductase [Hyphodiscus hymeniophilus]|uniref:NADPH-protochlorophyllide oxidoreductase n=1 Tax=Hyphodiscus hymeniophilus TaxID=353542 RepID=A0A9P6VKC2_9HELO|nr:NADPH-protochlorophyllide oxidoreductase [Hyphodiscus hymeniophilus]